MSILIPGMEMPKGCATCPYCDRAWNKPKCKAKSVQGRFMEQRLNLDRTRQKWCPLIPVPPHGRLIDADVADDYAYDELAISPGYRTPYEASRNMQKIYLAMPTIIPAEEGEGDV